VSATLRRAERDFVRKNRAKRPLEELVALAAKRVGPSASASPKACRAGLEAEQLSSRSRQKKYSQARSFFAWLAIEEEGYPAAMAARFLGMSRVGVKKALDRWTQE